MNIQFLLTFFLASACGKEVTRDVPQPVPETEIFCIKNCEVLEGSNKRPPLELTFANRMTNHNRLICQEFRLFGSGSKQDLGCIDAPKTVTLTSKLSEPGQCQRVQFYSKQSTLGKYNSKKNPGNYELCEENGDLWVNTEDFMGVVDFNDAVVDITAQGAELDWEVDGDQVYICVTERD